MTTEARVQAFWAMLRQTPAAADCDLCLSQLEAYVQAQLDERAYQAEFDWLGRHLDSCPACAEAYGLLYELVWTETNSRLPPPTRLPPPDLSFLHHPPAWLAALTAALQTRSDRLSLQLNEQLARLLAPVPVAAPTRSLGDGRYQPKLLELTPDQAQAAQIPFTLTAFADHQQLDHCLVEITVQPPGQSWPDLGGRPVTVTAGEQTFSATTDDWGTAVFPDLPRSELDRLEIVVRSA